MRRSAAIRLTLLSAASLAMAACDEAPREVSEHVVTTEAACRAVYGSCSANACHAAFREAEAAHVTTAPRFPTMERCAAGTGAQCREATPPNLSGYSIPVLAGVLIGRAPAGGERGVLPVYSAMIAPAGSDMAPACAPGATTPECQRRSGNGMSSSTSRNGYFHAGKQVATGASTMATSRPVSPTPAGRQALAEAASTSIVARGGLGAAGRSFDCAAS